MLCFYKTSASDECGIKYSVKKKKKKKIKRILIIANLDRKVSSHLYEGLNEWGSQKKTVVNKILSQISVINGGGARRGGEERRQLITSH